MNEQRWDRLREAIEHAAHRLPAQGPITAFIHHNTLHAYEDLPFEKAVIKGSETFGCHPYLPEQHYRDELARGRILRDDIEAVLIDELGERGDELLGFLGTRFHLRMSMVEHPWRAGTTAELRWIVAETDALRRFREETPRATRDRLISATRRWFMRDLRGEVAPGIRDDRMPRLIEQLDARFDRDHVERWDDSTWEAFCLHMLWLICQDGVRDVAIDEQRHRESTRHRDRLLELTGHDSDLLVDEVMIRFSAAFLDQGFADWQLPDRDQGFFRSFMLLYSESHGPPDRWLRGLRAELKRLDHENTLPLESLSESLHVLGIEESEQQPFITQSLLALRGYAGMIWQTETRADRVARPAPPGSLVEFLAVRLLLERFALKHLAATSAGYHGPLSTMRAWLSARTVPHSHHTEDHRAFQVFQLAQLAGWPPEELWRLSRENWRGLVEEMESFSGIQRRRIYHLAYERHYRTQALDALVLHAARERHERADDRANVKDSDGARNSRSGAAPPAGAAMPQNGSSRRPDDDGRATPTLQVVCCLDEREESFRRHLEEAYPEVETFGGVGFYSVAMYYRGAADAHFRPLCPVVVQPTHYVREHVVDTFEPEERRRRKRRRAIGTVTHQVHVGSRTFAGGWLAAVLGSVASLPLVTRILFPRATARLRAIMGGFVRPPAVTKMQLERLEADPGPEDGHLGYSVAEMATIVERFLRDIGLTHNFAPLIICCGHGSSSLNNPHESAHDCGACGGGRGGPNARAFAYMANHRDVRQLLSANGLVVPPQTMFVSAYHNTCDDSITYYDLDNLPRTHQARFNAAKAAMDEARMRNAHERCRRFESAELDLTLDGAIRHVEGRAEDLSQVRPEYGHATNSLCFVGRREWSRGMFLDRRAFLQSYDPRQDDEEQSILTRILQAAVPVCAGINLEYYFSFVDPVGYGCGTKLPHNITSLLGVMNGAASDLRTGLPWQMVEIHEPVRLLFVIESTPAAMLRIMERDPGIDRLVRGHWIQLATFDSASGDLRLFRHGVFEKYRPRSNSLPRADSSLDWYRGWRDHLGFATISKGSGESDVRRDPLARVELVGHPSLSLSIKSNDEGGPDHG